MQHYCEHCKKFVEARRAPFSNSLICSICGAEFGADFLAPGTIVSGFRIEEEIGRGSFGVVYKSLQLNLERMVALKVLSDELARDSEFVDNFFREARMAASLSHPNIVQAFDAGATPEGIYYFAMELIEGETLESRIHRVGRMDPFSAVPIALKIAQALDYAWDRQRLSHGDIKPENIILNSSGEAKLADLGLAKIAHEERTGHLMVTPLYAPPELISGSADYDAVRADIYSFGGTFYHMLAGVPPFNEDDPDRVMDMHLNDTPESLGERFRVNSDISFITDRMLSKNPDERPASWREIIEFLEAVDLDVPTISKSTRRSPAKARHGRMVKRRKTTVYMIASLAAVLFFLLSVLWAVSRSRSPEFKNAAPQNQAGRDYEWNKLKTDIKFLSERKALELVSKYIDTRKENVPVDALKTLEALKLENRKLQEQQRIGDEFDNELKALKEKLANTELVSLPPRELMNIQTRIINLFKQISEHKFLFSRLSQNDRKLLDTKVAELKDGMINNQSSSAMATYESIDRRRAEHAARQAETDKAAAETALQIDRLILGAAKLQAIPAQRRDFKAFSSCFADVDAKKLPPTLASALALLDSAYRLSGKLDHVIVSCKNLFKDCPPTDQGPFKDYLIVDITPDTIHLEQKLDYGVLKRRLALSKMSMKAKTAMVCAILAVEDKQLKLNKDNTTIILRELLNCGDFTGFANFLKGSFCFNQQEKLDWEAAAALMSSATAEAAAIEQWHKLEAYFRAGRYPETLALCKSIAGSHGNTETFKRHKDEIALLMAKSRAYSPEVQARDLVAEFDAAMKRQDLPDAFDRAVSASSRYGRLKSLSQETLAELVIARDRIMSAIIERNRDTNIDQLPMPYLNWNSSPPASGWVIARKISAMKRFDDTPGVSEALSIFGALDSGNWEFVEDNLSACRSFEAIAVRLAGERDHQLAAPVLMNCAIAAIRYDRPELARQCLDIIGKAAANDSPDAIIHKLLYLGLCRELRLANELNQMLDTIDYAAMPPTRDSFRLALASLSRLLDAPAGAEAEFSKRLSRFKELFATMPELVADFQWLDLAEKILHGRFVGDNLNSLASTQCAIPDACAGILLDAAMTAHAKGAFPKESAYAMATLADNSCMDNFANSPLRRKSAMFRLALTDNPDELRAAADAALKRTGVGIAPLYPSLIMLSIGLDLAAARLNTDNANTIYRDFMIDSPLAAQSEKDAMAKLDPASAISTIDSMIQSGKPAKAFWHGILAILGNIRNSKDSMAILRKLRENSPVLLREERLMLQKLEHIIRD